MPELPRLSPQAEILSSMKKVQEEGGGGYPPAISGTKCNPLLCREIEGKRRRGLLHPKGGGGGSDPSLLKRIPALEPVSDLCDGIPPLQAACL